MSGKTNENIEKAKELAEKGKVAAMEQLNKLSDKADAIPFFKGNKTRKLVAFGGIIVVLLFVLSWIFGGNSVESATEEVLREEITKNLENGFAIDKISNYKLREVSKNKYEGSADVIIKNKKTGKKSGKLSYKIDVKRDGDQILVKYVSEDYLEYIQNLGAIVDELIDSDDDDE